jgi:hypothetical protein
MLRSARRSAAHAPVLPGPSFAATSRHTAGGASPGLLGIALTGSPAARPPEISSRSASDILSGDRLGSGFADRKEAPD